MDIQQIGVVGAGLMGTNIALDFARAGYRVTLTDGRAAALPRSLETIRENLGLLEQHGLLREGTGPVLGRVRATADLAETVGPAELVMEAVSEELPLKQELFREFERLTRPTAILASNTSSFMPTSLAAALSRPERVLVTHYWNPAHLMPVVELVAGERTAPETLDRMEALYRGMGKRPVRVRREALGFIGNRLQLALVREALALVEAGIATPEDVDAVVSGSFGRRYPVTGVFGTMDLAGLDVVHAVASALFPDLSTRTGPGPLLSDRVARGRLGVKTGAGWSDYPGEEAAALRSRLYQALLRWHESDDGASCPPPGDLTGCGLPS